VHPETAIVNRSLSSNLLVPFEAVINRCIAQDARLAAGISRHGGKVLQLDVTVPAISIQVHFYPASVVLSFTGTEKSGTLAASGIEVDSAPDGTISGSALTLLRLMTEKDSERSLVNPGIRIGGDSEFVQSVYRLFLDMEIDWQEPLSKVIGDVPTHGLEQLLGSIRDFARGAADSLKRNLDEYLHEESRMVPPGNQVDIFDQDLDSLRLRLDRLQARIQLLTRQLAEHTGQPEQ